MSHPFQISLTGVKLTKPKRMPLRPWQPVPVGGTAGFLEGNQQKWTARADRLTTVTSDPTREPDSVAAFLQYVSVKHQQLVSRTELVALFNSRQRLL